MEIKNINSIIYFKQMEQLHKQISKEEVNSLLKDYKNLTNEQKELVLFIPFKINSIYD